MADAKIDIKINLDTEEALKSAQNLNDAINGTKDNAGKTLINGKITSWTKLVQLLQKLIQA